MTAVLILSIITGPAKGVPRPIVNTIPESLKVTHLWTNHAVIDGISIHDEVPWGTYLAAKYNSGRWTVTTREDKYRIVFDVHLIDMFGIRRVVRLDRFGYAVGDP